MPEDTRYNFGFRLGRFRASGDTAQAILARQLIDLVDAAAYLPTEERSWEIDRTLDQLRDAHINRDNFYTEPAIARRLEELVGQSGAVPDGLISKYVFGVVEVFLTNGNGTAYNADPIYRELISRFGPLQASLALRSFTDPEIATKLNWPLPQQKGAELLQLIAGKLTGRSERELFDAVAAFPGNPAALAKDAGIKILLQRFAD